MASLKTTKSAHFRKLRGASCIFGAQNKHPIRARLRAFALLSDATLRQQPCVPCSKRQTNGCCLSSVIVLRFRINPIKSGKKTLASRIIPNSDLCGTLRIWGLRVAKTRPLFILSWDHVTRFVTFSFPLLVVSVKEEYSLSRIKNTLNATSVLSYRQHFIYYMLWA